MSRYDRAVHQVDMFFQLRGTWDVQFLEPDLKTPLPRRLSFKDPAKIRELARRGSPWHPRSEAGPGARHRHGQGRDLPPTDPRAILEASSAQ